MPEGIALIAGLGNPGDKYAMTRHNVGLWFIEKLQRAYSIHFSLEKKFKAETGQFSYNGKNIRVIVPNTFMNLSGEAIAPMCSFFRISPSNVLVVHDELDFEPGTVKLKVGGGHGGHNGLRDIISRLGSNDFVRLRIGIGHPGNSNQVSNYVLKRPNHADSEKIESAIDQAIAVVPDIFNGNYQKIMDVLHRQDTSERFDQKSVENHNGN